MGSRGISTALAALAMAMPAGAAAQPSGMFLRLRPHVRVANAVRTLERAGVRVTNRFPAIRMVFAVAPAARLRAAIAGSRQIAYAQAPHRVVPETATAGWATGTAIAGQPVGGGPYFDATGRPLTGKGVGIAIVDSGVQPSHPDFAGRYANNLVVNCIPINIGSDDWCQNRVQQDAGLADLDVDSGHGTHVAGIAAGDGSSSHGEFRGVAPEATITSLNIGVVATNLTEAVAYQWVLDHAATATPPIRVLNMSYGEGSGATEDPEHPQAEALLARELVKHGVTVVVAAGNAGGDGSTDATSSMTDDPAVIGVANYDDLQLGSRRGHLRDDSSRGLIGTPRTYPKISAPGTFITSTCLTGRPLCADGVGPWQPWYSEISGTSMAAPQVTGAVALITQARPDLTPEQIRAVIQDNALRFGSGYEPDPARPGGVTSFDKGAGLLDLPAALDALRVPHGALPAPGTDQVIAEGDAGDAATVDISGVTATPSATGVRYRVSFASPVSSANLTIHQIIDGVAYDTAFSSVSGDVAEVTVPYTALGDPASGSVAHGVVITATSGSEVDVAPGDVLEAQVARIPITVTGPGPETLGHPQSGRFTIVR